MLNNVPNLGQVDSKVVVHRVRRLRYIGNTHGMVSNDINLHEELPR